MLERTHFLWSRGGYNLFLFDFRGHGESGPGRTSLSRYEIDDLRAALAHVRFEHPREAARVGIFAMSMGGALAHADGSGQSGAVVIQGKTLFKNVETNSWGLGIAGGYATQPGKGQSGSPYFYLPGSLSLADDRVVLHANLGAIRLREVQETRMTWGLSSEIAATDRTYVIAETFGLNVGRPSIQAGLRYWIVPGHVQVDSTIGTNLGDFQGERWLSIGLRLISPPIF